MIKKIKKIICKIFGIIQCQCEEILPSNHFKICKLCNKLHRI